jgi:hypothetical protein
MSSLKIMKNQNNSKVLQIIRPKCPGIPIGAKQERIVTWSVKVTLTNWRTDYLQPSNAQILSDLNRPMRVSRRAKIWYV